MTRALMLVPAGTNCGLTSICLGLLRGFDQSGVRSAFFKPIAQQSTQPNSERQQDISIQVVSMHTHLQPPPAEPLQAAQRALQQGHFDDLLGTLLARYGQAAAEATVVVIEGLVVEPDESYSARLNVEIARALNAEVILVCAPEQRSDEALQAWLDYHAQQFARTDESDMIGVILNKVSATPAHWSAAWPLLGCVPWNPALMSIRVSDLGRGLTLQTLHAGQQQQRRIQRIALLAQQLPAATAAFEAGTLVITSGDRLDLILAAALAATSGIALAGILLTDGIAPTPACLELMTPAFATGLPLLVTPQNLMTTAQAVSALSAEVASDDPERVESVMDFVAQYLDVRWLQQHLQVPARERLSPAAFRYQLTERARALCPTIVLPEGEDPRTLAAAAICSRRGMARCILLGRPDPIRQLAQSQGIDLPAAITLIDPMTIRERYVTPMVKLREEKGLTPEVALALLEDPIYVGTMMVATGEADGLVSGAVHTTANTVRPALQLIKTHTSARVVSSVFFMLLPDQVLVYGDCAINTNPDASTLADIAIQSADSARAFGIEPRVAMISYSTGTSGAGADVEKVRTATQLVKERRPDLVIDGPVQYDAASSLNIARAKAPNSPVAGRATVFVFPDLNTGNTTYKAVQRSANVVSVGPLLQGLRAPVNDLSRGASIDDIVYTIALTAVQTGARCIKSCKE